MLADCLSKSQVPCQVDLSHLSVGAEQLRLSGNGGRCWPGKEGSEVPVQQVREKEEGEHVSNGTSLGVSPGKLLLLGVGGPVWGDSLSCPSLAPGLLAYGPCSGCNCSGQPLCTSTQPSTEPEPLTYGAVLLPRPKVSPIHQRLGCPDSIILVLDLWKTK